MKKLLRMSLFIIARAGLCLAVVAWTVGQWWGVSANFSPTKCIATLEPQGWTLSQYKGWNPDLTFGVTARRFGPAFFSGDAPLGWSIESFPNGIRTFGRLFPPGSKWENAGPLHDGDIDWDEVKAEWARIPTTYDNHLFRLPGLLIYWFEQAGPRWRISLSHWLIISLFTALNIALHFIYSKRSETKPCEV